MQLNLSIRQRIVLSFSVMVLLVIVASVLGLVYTISFENTISASQEGAEQIERINDLQTSGLLMATFIDQMLLTRQSSLIEREINSGLEDYGQKLLTLQAQSWSENPEVLAQIQQEVDSLQTISTKMTDTVGKLTEAAQNGQWSQAQFLRHNDLASSQRRLAENLDQLSLIVQNDVEASVTESLRLKNLTRTFWIATALGASVIGLLAGFFTVSSIVQPISALVNTAQAIRDGDLTIQAEVTTQDEVGILATTFNSMTAQLRDTLEGLEERIADRTKALATSAEVSRRLANILDPGHLASEVVNEVRAAFDYYYAQIYLLDDAGENLVIAGGTGEAGAAMMGRGHSLPKGRGLVGRAADTNASVLIPNVSQEEGWLPNELLPETKAEAAVPIAIGDQVLGVLDVQHNLVDGLSQEDVILLESLAGQVAISLQNARSYEETQKQAKLESLVNVIGQKIQRTTSVEDTLQTAIRELGTAIGASRVRARIQPVSSAVATEPIAPAEPSVAVVAGEDAAFDAETIPVD